MSGETERGKPLPRHVPTVSLDPRLTPIEPLGEAPTIGRTRAEDTPAGAQPEPGDRIGSFEVERVLGAGAMGVVLLARDADLGRRVAIKVLASHYGDDEKAQQRMLREAQSVAQLQHPNVVALHQVGIHEGRVFLVMEYVDGGTLRQWVDAEPRTWIEILDAYRQAGAGLVAAHAAGLVHRDFKPDNVLIGRDGRVRVSDFGLVGAPGSVDTVPTPVSLSGDVRLTQTGTVLGTPAYMAPEQFAGTGVEAAADQFAFCVSLFEALYGCRPFRGDNAGALLLSIESREIVPPPRGRKVPRRIRRLIERGLAPDPGDRHPSLAGLVGALEVRPRSRRTTAVAVGAGVLGLGLLSSVLDGGDAGPEADAKAPCPAADAPIPEWNDARAEALHDALAAAEFADAESTAVRASSIAAARAEQLARVRHEVCVAAPEVDAEVAARMTACAEQLRTELAMTVDLLTGSLPVDVAAVAPAMLLELPPTEVCSSPVSMKHRVPLPVGSADQHEQLWHARLWIDVGHVERGAALAKDSAAKLQGTESPLLADALLLASRLPHADREFEAAEALLRDGISAARAVDDRTREAAGLAMLMASMTSDDRGAAALAFREQAEQAAADAGPEWIWPVQLQVARALSATGQRDDADASASLALDTLGSFESPRPLPTSLAHEVRGRVLDANGKTAEATEQYRAALTAIEAYGPNHPRRATLLTLLARSIDRQGNVAGAREHFDEAARILEAAGERHVFELAQLHMFRGDLERRLSETDEAAKALRRSVALFETDDDYEPHVARSLVELGIVEFMRGNNREADGVLARAAKIAARHPDSPVIDIARLEGMAGGVAIALGNLERGLEHHKNVLAEYERRFGPTNEYVVRTQVNVGDIAMYMRRCDEAQDAYRRALRIRADLGMERDDDVMRIVVGQATCDAITGDIDDARDGLARVEKEVGTGATAPWRGGRLEMLRAELSLRDGDLVQARLHADRARAIYASLGPAHTMDVDHVDRWLEDHHE